MSHLTYGLTLIGMSEDPKLGNNQGFKDKGFEKEMRNVGWIPGYSWCCLLMALCAKHGLPHLWEKLRKLFNPGVLKTFQNFQKAGYVVSKVPTPGALAFWQHYKNGKPTPQGHIGAVCEDGITEETFRSLEGNTDVAGSRDGGTTAIKTRKLDFSKKTNGLVLLGFVSIDK